jgi:hypothetical protein
VFFSLHRFFRQKKLLWAVFIICIWVFLPKREVVAQKKPVKKFEQSSLTGHSEKLGRPPKQKKIRYIITNDTRETLSGNKCAQDVTHSLGFEFLPMPKGGRGNKNEAERRLNNFGVKFMLLFRNGPLWEYKLNKRLKECKYKLGDYVG